MKRDARVLRHSWENETSAGLIEYWETDMHYYSRVLRRIYPPAPKMVSPCTRALISTADSPTITPMDQTMSHKPTQDFLQPEPLPQSLRLRV